MSAIIWLITGASSGIGLALAEYVLSQGDKVIVTVRSPDKFPESLRIAGASAIILDLGTGDADIYNAGQQALKVYGRIDVLVNNAAYGIAAPVEELDLNEVREQFQANVYAPIALIQALLPSFRAQRSGSILNISSVGALCPGPAIGTYCASKAALEAFSESLSQEVALFNIRVFIVEPGYFLSNFLSRPALVASAARTTIYTDPSQGYGNWLSVPKRHAERGEVGDPVKLAIRLYEIVSGTGMANGLVEGQENGGKLLRVPMGSDSGRMLLGKIDLLQRNVKAFEPIWKSTDVDAEKLKTLL